MVPCGSHFLLDVGGRWSRLKRGRARWVTLALIGGKFSAFTHRGGRDVKKTWPNNLYYVDRTAVDLLLVAVHFAPVRVKTTRGPVKCQL
jgi:hypothetical protein